VKYKRTKVNGIDCVAIEYDAVVNIGQLRSNLEQFKIEAAIANKKVQETEEMLEQVATLAPDLLAAHDAISGRPTPPPVPSRYRPKKK
jgi:hypothetical protein